jgi:hypothetical protein
VFKSTEDSFLQWRKRLWNLVPLTFERVPGIFQGGDQTIGASPENAQAKSVTDLSTIETASSAGN